MDDSIIRYAFWLGFGWGTAACLLAFWIASRVFW